MVNTAGMSDSELKAALDGIVKRLPMRAPIFLPTEKVPLREQVSGLTNVLDIYRNLDAVYRPRLRALREQYKHRRRCFVIGNGPSLNRTDLAVLKDEVTFAVNGFFLKVPELDWLPTFYVVEDHLVAEDRRESINAFKCPTKIFPAYLAYCLDDSPDTIYLNHRSRKRYPHAFDFSTNAEELTYAGCTVTFTCLQLAFYFGFKEIYLVGVDADYAIPSDTQLSNTYGTGVLDMASKDPNHFHPDYFGKGFRWHDPQVHKTLEAYAEAKRVTESGGCRILNAGVGGKLEVFDRVLFHTLFPGARSPEEMERLSEATLADRAAVRTRRDGPADHNEHQRPAPLVSVVITNYNYGGYIAEALESIRAQTYRNWEIIVVDDGSTDNSRSVITEFVARYPDRIKAVFQTNSGQGAAFNEGFKRTKGEIVCFLDSDDYWFPSKIARVVDEHSRYGFVQHNLDKEGRPYRSFAHIENHLELMVRDGEFDFFVPTSGLSFRREVLEHIFPLPENDLKICADAFMTRMALHFATLKCVDDVLGFYRVHGANAFYGSIRKSDPHIIFRILDLVNARLRTLGKPVIPYDKKLRSLKLTPRPRREVGDKQDAVLPGGPGRKTSGDKVDLPQHDRAAHAHVEESEVISVVFGAQTGLEHTMIDVGAHSGGSARHFVDKGWYIYCFEPDAANRERLVARFGNRANVTIDARAVGEKVELRRPFFSSTESTGISGLHAFHDTHQQTALVDVTTISDVVEQHGIDRVDFLKIDTEGWDLHVLRGVPWQRLRPAAIECEFEDAKTTPLGYSCQSMADFLVEKGYAVYVSEWHPIVRYGVPHDWCRLARYPQPLRSSQAWGNLLAFVADPGAEAIADAFKACVRFRKVAHTGETTQVRKEPLVTSEVAKVAAPLHHTQIEPRVDAIPASAPQKAGWSLPALYRRIARWMIRGPVAGVAVDGKAVLHQALERHRIELEALLREGRTEIDRRMAALESRVAALDKNFRYWQTIRRICDVAGALLPQDATVLVVSKGDDQLLQLNGRQAWHFPRTEDGVYAGHHPADSAAAIAHLEALRAKGADFLLVPDTAFWWFEHYTAFKQHLDGGYHRVPSPPCCAIYRLSARHARGHSSSESLQASAVLRATAAERISAADVHEALSNVQDQVRRHDTEAQIMLRQVQANVTLLMGHAEQQRYDQLVQQIRDVVDVSLPRDPTVLVMSKGDDRLLHLGGRKAWHFPRADDGAYAGYYPADSAAAIAHLEALRGQGAAFLVVPSTAFWWFDYYSDFTRHLARYERVLTHHNCVIYKLSAVVATDEKPIQKRRVVSRAKMARAGAKRRPRSA